MAQDSSFIGVRVAGRPATSLWNIECKGNCINKISQYSGEVASADGRVVSPGLCHPHIHLDKCFLLSHPKYADLEINVGDFAEAMQLTSKAKSRFDVEDLLERGRALIEESISYGVTHLRAFVEVDEGVGKKCLDAGLILKNEFKDRCHVQICAFAQDPVFSKDDGGASMRQMLEAAALTNGVDVVGSTPYVETDVEKQKENIDWMVNLAQNNGKMLDFHLDYNLDAANEPMVYYVIESLKAANWDKSKVVTLGHCTRLTLFNQAGWKLLRSIIDDLPISFVGLPTSDLFMMGRVDEHEGGGERFRGTLQIPQMIKEYDLQGAVGVNNVGNAFTPQGSCDPLSVAALGVGIYQAGTKTDAELLMQCVSTRARMAIGLGEKPELEIGEGGQADFTIFGVPGGASKHGFRQRTSVQELVYDACQARQTVFQGKIVSS